MRNFMISIEVQYLSDFGDSDGFTKSQLFSVEAETEEEALGKVWRLAKPRFKKKVKKQTYLKGKALSDRLVEEGFFIRALYDGYPSHAIYCMRVKPAEIEVWNDTFSL